MAAEVAAAAAAAPTMSETGKPSEQFQDHEYSPTSVRKADSAAVQPGAWSNNSGSATTSVTQTLERRVDWLCEDLEVVRRRVQDTLGPEASTAEGKAAKSGGIARLHSLANQLLGELAEEREWRENLEAELSSIETSLLQERAHREKALETLSVELKETMKSLVRRIDTGLLNGTQELNTRAAKTEAGLKSLIQRVEEGLVTGSKFLQETLGGTDFYEVSSTSSKATASSNSGHVGTSASVESASTEVGDPLMKVWGQLQEENLRLRQKRVQLEARQLRSRLNSRSPNSTSLAASPGPSSRNRSPAGGRGQNLGTGFRFKAPVRKDEAASVVSAESSPVSTQATVGFGIGFSDANHQMMRDIDTMSTASSSLPNTKGSDDGSGATRTISDRPSPQPRFIADARLAGRRGSQTSQSPTPVTLAMQAQGLGRPLQPGMQSGIHSGLTSPGGVRMPATRSPQPVLQATRASNLKGTEPALHGPANGTTRMPRQPLQNGIRSGTD